MSKNKNYEIAPPSYSEIDEKKPLLRKDTEVTVRQVFGIRRSTLLLSFCLIFYVIFIIIGSLIFTILEAPVEEELRQAVIQARSKFMKNNPTVKDADLESLIEIITIAGKKGVQAIGNATGEPNWTFGESLFFASTVLTTIGYGQVTPLSKEGKYFCIVFGICGIPLTTMLLTALVERLMSPTARFLQYLNSKLEHLYQPFYIRLLHLWVVFIIFVVFFLLIPAAAFAYFEPDWDYFDAIYYCFVSLTTIGLGDYVPGDSPNQPHRTLYKIMTTLYLYAGLVFLILTLTVFYEIPQLNFGLLCLLQSDETSASNIDPEKIQLQTPGTTKSKYSQQFSIPQGSQHRVVKVKARRDDSPSPEETSPTQGFP